MSKLDRYDLSILAELQRDARISNQELAERIGLSPSPCSRRVKQLEDDGSLNSPVALQDRQKLSLTPTAFVQLTRKGVLEGQSLSVRVHFCGLRNFKNQHEAKQELHNSTQQTN